MGVLFRMLPAKGQDKVEAVQATQVTIAKIIAMPELSAVQSRLSRTRQPMGISFIEDIGYHLRTYFALLTAPSHPSSIMMNCHGGIGPGVRVASSPPRIALEE